MKMALLNVLAIGNETSRCNYVCFSVFFFLLSIVYTYPKFIRKSRNARAFNALFLNFFIKSLMYHDDFFLYAHFALHTNFFLMT